ncbi:MAG: nucleoside deaminase [Oscillospiraceae bacterium]|nr:nucleoside deaminase [Oscillospiraceae bacterium]
MDFEPYMREALSLAEEAAGAGEVPVGCVVVGPDGSILGRGRNRRQEAHDATAHAEIEAIRQACAALGDWRLEGCTIFVTLEPCPMCAGAIINSRVPVVVYGAREAVSGSCGSVIDLFMERYGHHPRVYPRVLAAESAALMQAFFQSRRQEQNKEE